MEGTTHAVSGWCAGVATAPMLGINSVGGTLIYSVVCTGAALGPDIDHPGAFATKRLGPLGKAAHKAAAGLSAWTFHKTRTPHDSSGKGTHRFLTHTVPWALMMGLLVALFTGLGHQLGNALGEEDAARVGGTIAVAPVVLMALFLAETKLNGRLDGLVLGAAAIGAGCLYFVDTDNDLWALSDLAVVVGVGVAIGHVAHDLGDAATEAPVPMLWPIPIQGKRWFPVNVPSWVRFPVGGPYEKRHVLPVFVLWAVALLPLVPDYAAWVIAQFVPADLAPWSTWLYFAGLVVVSLVWLAVGWPQKQAARSKASKERAERQAKEKAELKAKRREARKKAAKKKAAGVTKSSPGKKSPAKRNTTKKKPATAGRK